jgi:phage-related protein
MLEAISAGIQRLWSAFINHPDVQATIEVISNALSTLWSWITQAGQAILEFFGVATGGQFDVVAALINVVGQAWNAMTYPLRVVIGAVQQVISAFNSFRTGQMDLPAFIMTVLQALVNVYLNTFGRIVQLIIQFGARMISSGVSAASRFVSNILNHIRQLPGRIYSALMTVVGRISSAIQSWISTAVSKVTTLISNITSPFSGVAGKISSALSGVVNAITQPFQNAWNAIKPIVDNINKSAALVIATYKIRSSSSSLSLFSSSIVIFL